MNRGFTTDTYRVSYHGYAHSHIDALCHILYKDQTYNGYARAEVNTEKGCTKLGIDNLKQGVITRGILIDIPRLKGVPYLEPGTPVYQSRTSRRGRRRPASRSARATRCCCAPAAGRGARSSDRGPSAAAPPASTPRSRRGSRRAAWRSSAATPRQDVVPSMVEGIALPVHTLLITALGINLLDNQDLERLAETAAKLKRWEFMLTIAPLASPAERAHRPTRWRRSDDLCAAGARLHRDHGRGAASRRLSTGRLQR